MIAILVSAVIHLPMTIMFVFYVGVVGIIKQFFIGTIKVHIVMMLNIVHSRLENVAYMCCMIFFNKDTLVYHCVNNKIKVNLSKIILPP